MALVSNNITPSSTLRRYEKTSISGSPNLRASHTIMGRVKFTTTGTPIVWALSWLDNSASLGGSSVARGTTGDPATQFAGYRFNSSGSPAATVSLASGTFVTGTWFHYAFVYDSSTTTQRLYVDGSLVDSDTSATGVGPNVTATRVVLGWIRGLTADVAVFNRALTAGEVLSMASYRQPQVTSGLLGFWRLDSDGTDSSGNSQTLVSAGSTGNTPTFSTSDNPPQPETPIVDVSGDAASSSAFSAQLSSLLSAAAASSTALSGKLTANVKANAASTSAFAGALRAQIKADATSSSTFAAYLRPRWSRRFQTSGTSSAFAFLTPTGINAQQPWSMMGWQRVVTPAATSCSGQAAVFGSSVYSLGFSNDGTNVNVSFAVAGASGDFVANNSWHHIAMVYDGAGTIARYIDGVAQTPVSHTPAAATWGDYGVGVVGTGAIAEFAQVKVWAGTGGALTATQVASERDFHNPHSNVSALRLWYQYTWQNPTWDDSTFQNDLNVGGDEALYEPPGDFLLMLAGSASSTSAFSGNLNTLKPIAGSAASSSALSATMSLSLPLAGAAASSSALAAQLQALVSGAAASSSAFAAALNTLKPLAGASASSSALSAALQALLRGDAASSSAFAGTLNTAKPVAGDLATASAFAAALGISGQFAANMASASALAATLFVTRELAGSAASSSALSAALGQNYAVVGALASASTLTGALSVIVPLSGAAASASAFGGKLSLTMFGNAASSSAFQGSLTAQIAGNASSVSALSGTVTLANVMAAGLASTSSLSAGLTVLAVRFLNATALSSSQFAGSLSITIPVAAGSCDTFTGSSVSAYITGPEPGPIIPSRPWPPRPR